HSAAEYRVVEQVSERRQRAVQARDLFGPVILSEERMEVLGRGVADASVHDDGGAIIERESALKGINVGREDEGAKGRDDQAMAAPDGIDFFLFGRRAGRNARPAWPGFHSMNSHCK